MGELPLIDNDVVVLDKEVVRKQAALVIQQVRAKYDNTPYAVDVELATRIINFITLLKHTGGALGGETFQLLDFQTEFIVETLAVLDRVRHRRKHSTAILFVPRKQGKTELLAAMNIWLFFGDPEKQKEQYIIASETTQAGILFAAMISMIKQEPMLYKLVDIWKSTKTIESDGGGFVDIFRVLSSTAGTKDGLKASALTADEAHAYKDSQLYDVMTESMAHRDQPLTIVITTAGYNKNGFFFRMLQYAKNVMAGLINDPTIYLMDFSLTLEDDWKDEANWRRVNPALGYGVKMEYLRAKFTKALHSATEAVSFKTKHLCMWVDAAVTWIKQEDWDKSNKKTFTEADFAGRDCYGGLDLASVTDLAAVVYVFPNEDKSYDVLCRFWVPEDNAMERSKTDKVSYLDWIDEGHITPTPGNVIDYDYIEYQIKEDAENFNILEMAFDRWNSHALVTNLEQEGMLMVGFGQGYKSMSSPVKEIEALVLKEMLHHGDNPVLNWNIANVAITSDPADNVKMDKSKAIEKIDGAVALAMAIGRAAVHVDEEVDLDSLIG